MTLSPLKRGRALQLAKLIEAHGRLLRLGVILRASAFVVAALLLAGVVDTNKEALARWACSALPNVACSPLPNILKNGLEAASGAIIVYLIIELRMAKVREKMEDAIRLIRSTDILSSIFEISLDRKTTQAWQDQLKNQQMTGILSRIDLYLIKNGDDVAGELIIADDILPLRDIDEKKNVVLGPSEDDSWACHSVRIKKDDGNDQEVSYDDARGGKQNLKYRLQLKENEKFTREIKLEKNMPSYVVNERKPARNGQPATTYVKKMIVDNHAFASGSHQLRFSVYVDSNLLSKNPPLKDRVRVVLRGITMIAEINSPVREHRRGQSVLFQVYVCKPDCVFLPHQGFSYSILLDQSAS